MGNHADKTHENKSQSVAKNISREQGGSESVFQFEDTRSEAIVRRKLQAMADNSSQVRQLRALQKIANNSPQAKRVADFQAMANDYAAKRGTQTPIQRGQAPASRVIQRSPLVDDKLNVAGENHAHSREIRPKEKDYCAIHSGSENYWEEQEFTRENGELADLPALKYEVFLSALQKALIRIGKLPHVWDQYTDIRPTEGTKIVKLLWEDVMVSERLAKMCIEWNPHGEASRNLLEQVLEALEYGRKNKDFETLAGISTELQPRDVTDERNAGFHSAAQESKMLGVWKIGLNHAEALDNEEERSYNLVQQPAFDKAVEEWKPPVEDSPRSTGAKAKGRSKCFLTSACVHARGLPDDCEELTLLREFRDGYVRELPYGEEWVELYYAHSPLIVERIDAEPEPQHIYDEIFTTIRKCVATIRRGELDWTFSTYVRLVLTLSERYTPENPIVLPVVGLA